jgi:aryl-alcohol dehydrogenase-like predicted oxidoreductase
MRHRTLGRLEVSAIGLGCMGMSDFYGPRDEAESVATLERALALGVTFYDTADMYGSGTNEELLGRVLGARRPSLVVATKFGIVRDRANLAYRGFNAAPDYVPKACDASLRRLGTDYIDLYYLHRPDGKTPIEDTVGAMARLVEAGKVRHLGLSEVSAETLRRAHAVAPITALQSEYSLWTREPEDGVLDACRELGIGFVPYSPLGRGFLSGEITNPEDFAPDDFRRIQPRFQGENFRRNLALVEAVKHLAADRGVTAAQLALAWVLAQGDDVVPIPGTKRVKYLEQNVAAVDLKLTASDLAALEAAFPRDAVAGTRYQTQAMAALNR